MASRIKDVETAGIEMELHTAVCNCFRWEGHGQNVRWIKQVNDGDPRKEDGVGLIFIFDKDGLPIRTLEVFPGDWVCCHPVDEIIMVMSDEEFSVMFRRHGVGEHSRAEAIETMHSMQKLAFMLIQKYGNVQNDDKGRPFHMVEIDEEMERSLNGETAKLVIEKSFEKMATLVCAVGGRK